MNLKAGSPAQLIMMSRRNPDCSVALFCGTSSVEKAIMAPAVKTARKTESRAAEAAKAMSAMAAKIRTEIGNNCENVGENFAEEARAMHYGKSPNAEFMARQPQKNPRA